MRTRLRLCAILALTALVPAPTVWARPSCAEGVVEAARAQIGRTIRYDPAYRVLDYPGGDVPIEVGVCTDVVIRAWRRIGLDLQRLVHEDMRTDFAAYPRLWAWYALIATSTTGACRISRPSSTGRACE